MLLSFFIASLAYVNTNCSKAAPSKVRAANEANLYEYVISKHYRCGSFLVRYSPYRNLMGVLMIDHENNGYRIEIFNIHSQKKIFDFEPVTLPIADFRLNEDTVIVDFADIYGTQIAYDVYTGGIIWQN